MFDRTCFALYAQFLAEETGLLAALQVLHKFNCTVELGRDNDISIEYFSASSDRILSGRMYWSKNIFIRG